MSTLLAIDPGPTESAWAEIDTDTHRPIDMSAWRPVAGWEDRYLISTDGIVLSLPNAKRKTSKILSRYPSTAGYPAVNLWRDNKMKRRSVHVLVLEAFVGPRPPGAVARHLNGNRNESTLRNLAWGTPSENSTDTVRHGHHPHSTKTHCPEGHPYAGDNLYIHPTTGQRVCRTCRRAQQLAWLRRRES